MPRRASLPGADLLFGAPAKARPGASAQPGPEPAGRDDPRPSPAPGAPAAPTPAAAPPPPPGPPAAVRAQVPPAAPDPVRAAGSAPRSRKAPRQRHDEKITFYCTDADLTRLEATRLALRAKHRLSSDRGRIVRAALAEILDDFDARGAESALVKRLNAE